MLRINLLPAYIAEQKKTQAAWGWAITTLVVCAAVPLVYRFAVQDPDYTKTLAEATAADTAAKAVEATRLQVTEEKQKIAPIQAKVNFVKDIQFFNRFPGLIYRNVAKYTYNGAEYSSMAVQGDGLSINAFVPKLDDVGRFYLTLFGNPDIKALSIKAMPDWLQLQAMNQLPPDARRGFPIQVTAQLLHPLVPPTAPLPGAAGAGAAGGTIPGAGGSTMPPSGMGMDSGSAAPTGAGPGAPPDMMGKGGK